MNKRTLVLAICGLLLVSVSLLAHHSLAGVYDMKGDKELAGAVKAVKFVNPHGSLTITVKENGEETGWGLTLGSATGLASRGVGITGPNALRTGDQIKVKFLPAKDGSPLGFLKTVIYPDGHQVQISSGSPTD